MGWKKKTDAPPTVYLRAKVEEAAAKLGASAPTSFGVDDDLVVQNGASFTATMQGGPPGAVGQVGVEIVTPTGTVVAERKTTDIIEAVPGSGVYVATLIAPGAAGQYMVVWDDGLSPATYGSQDLLVSSAPAPAPPPVLSEPDETLPCQIWISGADILAYCPTAQADSIAPAILDDYAATASEVLYRLSGRQFPGVCTKTARPCRVECACDWRVLAWYNNTAPGSLYGGWGGTSWLGANGNSCGCGVTSRVRLAGYPIRDVTLVTVDGVTVAPEFYRLDNRRYLTAVKSNGVYKAWPVCQDMSLPDAPGAGVFTVTYEWGQAPPILGVKAALELGCQLAMALLDQDSCTLPPGTVQVQRQGVTINRSAMSAYIEGQTTGLQNVDAFLATYNPHRLTRRASVYSPDVQRFARRQGT